MRQRRIEHLHAMREAISGDRRRERGRRTEHLHAIRKAIRGHQRSSGA
jgi:hypothetical protein